MNEFRERTIFVHRRVVLYAHDFEPITIIELPDDAIGYLLRLGQVRVPVWLPVRIDFSEVIDLKGPPIVTITADKLVLRDGRETILLFTHQESDAMLLKSVFLPGQRPQLQRERKEAYGRGAADFLAALIKASR